MPELTILDRVFKVTDGDLEVYEEIQGQLRAIGTSIDHTHALIQGLTTNQRIKLRCCFLSSSLLTVFRDPVKLTRWTAYYEVGFEI